MNKFEQGIVDDVVKSGFLATKSTAETALKRLLDAVRSKNLEVRQIPSWNRAEERAFAEFSAALGEADEVLGAPRARAAQDHRP